MGPERLDWDSRTLVTIKPCTAKGGQTKKVTQNFKISLYRMLRNKKRRVKVLPKRFHLNRHTTEFSTQSQKLELHTG